MKKKTFTEHTGEMKGQPVKYKAHEKKTSKKEKNIQRDVSSSLMIVIFRRTEMKQPGHKQNEKKKEEMKI